MSNVPLPRDVVAQRAKNAVAEFPVNPDDLWEIKMRPETGYLSVGVSHKGYTSKPPVPEEREINHLHREAVKKKKDAAEEVAARKRTRKEKHEKECKIAHAEGKPRPATPESTEEEDSSDVELNFSDDDEAATGAGSPPVYRGAGGEEVTVTLGEARLTSGSLMEPPPVRTERGAPTPVAGRRSSTPVTGQRSPPLATGRRTPAPAVSMGSGGSAVSAETPAQTASGLRADPRVAPLGQSSRGVSVPQARRSGTGKRCMSARSGSRAIARDAAQLAPTKTLKTGAHATSHTAPQPPIGVDPALEAGAEKLREAMARGALESGGDAGQSGIVTAAGADAKEEVSRGGADDATRLNIEIEAGWGDADSVAHPEESAPRAPAVEETCVPKPARAGDEVVVAAATAQTAPENVEPVVELPLSSDEFGDSRDINPAAAAYAADRIADEQEEEAVWKAQFEVSSQIQDHLDRALGLHRTTDLQITAEGIELTRLYSQMHWLGQHNADLVLQNIDTNTKMTDLGARQRALEEDLRVRTTLEQKEAELQHEKATVATLTGTLEEKGRALEEKKVAIRKAEATLKEKEDSLSSLEGVARVQQEEAPKNIAEQRQKVADETSVKEAVNTALMAAQVEYTELERTAIAEHAKRTFHLGVLRALAVASTHYIMDLQRVSLGYVIPTDADTDAASSIMDDATAAAEEFATVLARKLEADIPPIAEFDAIAFSEEVRIHK
ncbi:uncharacterized protein LOC120645836 [Panicum virgatum]|uniref:uncharacterized protein LOC120645836 n=1 Tax=Panicum virgatum TaxID=38727 RepID=UPI0019D5CA72|nr:uncharacterized protein LOC120645836 [Panicum virgatum]